MLTTLLLVDDYQGRQVSFRARKLAAFAKFLDVLFKKIFMEKGHENLSLCNLGKVIFHNFRCAFLEIVVLRARKSTHVSDILLDSVFNIWFT